MDKSNLTSEEREYISPLPENSSIKALRDAMYEAMSVKASGRTRRYVVNSRDVDFNSRLDQVCQTIEKIRSTRGTSICIDDESYSLSEYKIPENIQNYIHSGRFWMTKGMELINDGILNFTSGFEAVTPIQFNRFFELYNENQPEGDKIKVVPFVRKHLTYGDFHYAYDGENARMLRVHDGSSGLGLELCQLAQIPNMYIEDCAFEKFQLHSSEQVGLWVLNLGIQS